MKSAVRADALEPGLHPKSRPVRGVYLLMRQGGSLRFAVVLLAVGCWLSVVSGQPAPDTILLPDSLGPLQEPYHVAFGGSSGDIYVASESSDIIVADGTTFQRIKRIETSTPVGGALLVAQHNKLYCSYPAQGRIGVIDCATNSTVGSILVGTGTRPTALCYSSGSDKLYCGSAVANLVSVIDCAADTVVATIATGAALAFAYDPTADKLYVATRDALLAIACQPDTVVARLGEIKAGDLCISRQRQRLYATGPSGQRPDTVFVVSTTRDSIVARMWGPTTASLKPGLVYNDATDRLYDLMDWGGGGLWYIGEFDCVGDTWTRRQYVGDATALALTCDTVRNRLLYLSLDSDYGTLSEYDCKTLAWLSEARVANHPDVLELDAARCRVLCGGGGVWGNAVLSAFECNDDSLNDIGDVPLQGWQQLGPLCHNPVAGKLYYRWGDGGGGVGVIDEQTNRVVAQIVLPQKYGYEGMACSRTSNKLYCQVASGLAVVDGAGDSLLKPVDFRGGSSPCWCPDGNKLYCTSEAGLAVLDCYTDSVVRDINLALGVGSLDVIDESLLLVGRGDGLTLIDCRKDSILVDTTVPGNIYVVAHSGNGKVYIVHHYTYDRLDVLNAGSLSLLATVDWPYVNAASLQSLVCSDSTHKLYWFARDSFLAIDTRSDTVVARRRVVSPTIFGCLDRSGRYLFRPADSTLVVYDTRSDTVAAAYATPPYPGPVVPNPELGCIYVGFPDAILSYADTLVVPGVCEEPASALRRLPQTIVRDILSLPDASGVGHGATSVLLDISGREVMNLHPGVNDVRALVPGVYFVREAQAPAVRKVVLLR